jgi:opacity protein-like surface antigen
MDRTLRSTLLATVLMAVPLAGRAQTLADYDYDELSFRGIGLDWGLVWPNKAEATDAWGLRIDLGFLGPAVRVVPSITYWSSEMKRSELGRLADALNELPALRDEGVVIDADDLGTVDWTDLALSIDVHGVFTIPGNVITYGGAGLGLHALNGRGESIDDTFVEDLLDTVAAGFAFMAGAEYEPTRHLRLYGEARYALASDIRYPQLRFGGAFMFPGRSAVAPNGGGR